VLMRLLSSEPFAPRRQRGQGSTVPPSILLNNPQIAESA
jgi:hypothetical protein